MASTRVPIPLNVIRDTLISLGSEVTNDNLQSYIEAMEDCWQDPAVRASWKPTNIMDLDDWLDWTMMTSSARWHGWDNWEYLNETKGPHAFDIEHGANCIPYPEETPTHSVIVKNLSQKVDIQDLLHVMGMHGAVTRIHRPKNKDGSFKKFAIVDYLTRVDARRAISWSNLMNLEGGIIAIEESAQ